jgi:tetratricopeptide (TPR) repeat protein
LRRSLLTLGIGVLAIAAIWWFSVREPLPSKSPAEISLAVPEDETIVRTLPGPDGVPERWTLSRRQMSGSELEQEALPAPKPRDTRTDDYTDSARALSSRALESWKQGDIRGAVDLFEVAIAADPDDWIPRSDYGRLLLLMTDYEHAWIHLKRAAELEQDNPRVWIDLITFYERNMLFERASYARSRASQLIGDQAIVRDETGLWRLEYDSIFP